MLLLALAAPLPWLPAPVHARLMVLNTLLSRVALMRSACCCVQSERESRVPGCADERLAALMMGLSSGTGASEGAGLLRAGFRRDAAQTGGASEVLAPFASPAFACGRSPYKPNITAKSVAHRCNESQHSSTWHQLCNRCTPAAEAVLFLYAVYVGMEDGKM